MKNKTIHFVFALLLVIVNEGFAQDNSILLYGFSSLPQSRNLNPGEINNHRFHIGVPGSNVQLHFTNSPFNALDIFEKGTDINENVSRTINSLDDKDYISLNQQAAIIDFGFRVRKNYFSLSVNQYFDFFMNYPTDIINKLWFTGDNYLGNDIDLSSFKLNAMVYTSIDLGYQRTFLEDKLTAGVKLRYLAGLVHARVTEVNTRLKRANDFEINILANNTFQLAGLDADFEEETFDLDPNPLANSGVGIDFGATYKLNDKFTFGASVLNLGRINWRNSVQEFQSKGELTYKGLELDLTQQSSIDSATNRWDKELESFDFIEKENAENYTTRLNPDVFINGRYALTKKHSFQGVFHTRFYENQSVSSLALYYHGNYGRFFQLMAGPQINKQGAKIGTGLQFNLAGLQSYFMVNDVMGVFNPGRLNELQMQFGINISIDKKKAKGTKKAAKRRAKTDLKDKEEGSKKESPKKNSEEEKKSKPEKIEKKKPVQKAEKLNKPLKK